MELLNVRIIFLTAALIHLLITAVVTLSIDMRDDEDPKIREYFYVRWKLLTCWFNVVALVYLPMRLYSDISSKTGKDCSKIKRLNTITDVIMTAILVPVIVYGDIVFWCVYLTNPTLIGPVRIFEYLPYWAQHSLHTVSLCMVVIDILLTPRRTPQSIKPRLGILWAFFSVYTAVVYYSYSKGQIVYSFMEDASVPVLIAPILIGFTSCNFIFYMQWFLIDYIWSKRLSNGIKTRLE